METATIMTPADKKQLAIQQADAKRKLRLGHYRWLIENDDERKNKEIAR